MALENPFKGMPKWGIYASLAGFTAIGGWFVVRHHSQTGSWNPWSAAPSGTTSTTAIDPVTGLPASQDDAIDPQTNLGYLAEAEQYGSVQAAEADVSQFGQSVASGSGVGVGPATYPVNGSPSGTQTGANYSSDATWSQAAQAGLTDVGYDATSVATALGQFLTGQPLSTAGSPSPWQIVSTAIGEYGRPPSGIQPVMAPPSGPATTATVPNVVGKTVPEAVSAITAARLVAGSHSTDSGTVNGQTPGAGKVVAVNSRVDLSVGAAAATTPPAAAAGRPSAPRTSGNLKDGAQLSWPAVPGAKTYQLVVQGTGGHDTGTSGINRQVGGTSAHVDLTPGRYQARVQVYGDAHNPWSSWTPFTVVK